MNSIQPETRPVLSIVIASWSGEFALRRCLESLLPQAHGAEIVVAFSGNFNPVIFTDEDFQNVHFVRGPSDATVFQLRSLGINETRGASIALIEDHSMVGPEWFQTLTSAQVSGWLVCGGPIENDSESTGYDSALYFAEYARFMPPIPSGEVTILSGANIFYDRATLWRYRPIWESDFYETDVNAALVNAGHKLHMLSNALVTSRLRMGLAEAMVHLFHGGIHFGNFRKSHSRPLVRWLCIIASPAIPIAMLVRIVRVTTARRLDRLIQVVRSLPYLLLLVCAWSLGEAAGYLHCVPGQAVPSQAPKG
jgi:hypothetical protein